MISNDNVLCTCTDKIPANHFKQFNEILIACGGRYVRLPYSIRENIRVEYEFVDDVGLGYTEFCERWNKAQLRSRFVKGDFMIRCAIFYLKCYLDCVIVADLRHVSGTKKF